MPELPEVETVMRGLKPVLEGRTIQSVSLRRHGLRFPFPTDFASRLSGQRIGNLTRLALYVKIFEDPFVTESYVLPSQANWLRNLKSFS